MQGYWILLGMMGSGKSTLGRALARLADVPFEDTDALLERRLGRPISQLFQIYGEEAFREHENAILRGLQPQRGVLATGGGIVTRAENWVEFRRLGRTIFLEVPLESLQQRLARSKRKRPLLSIPEWEKKLAELYQARLPLYREADLVFPIPEDDFDGTAARLHQVLGEP